jgi:hypothetical protein
MLKISVFEFYFFYCFLVKKYNDPTKIKSCFRNIYIYIYITFVVVVVDDVPKHETEGRECTGQRHGKC